MLKPPDGTESAEVLALREMLDGLPEDERQRFILLAVEQLERSRRAMAPKAKVVGE